MARGEAARGSRRRARAAGVAVPAVRVVPGRRLELARVLPSGRSLALAFALLAGTLGAIVLARETSMFAVQRVEVSGVEPELARAVEGAVDEQLGRSLLKVDPAAVERAVEALPAVLSARLDRAFPHTLELQVVPERPVAVVRQGAASYLVSARGRVIGELERGAKRRLPRIWVTRAVAIEVGGLAEGDLRPAVTAVAPLGGVKLPGRVVNVRATGDELTLVLRSGRELRLGEPTDVRLKLAVAGRVLPLLGPEDVYLDVSVPSRPVAGTIYEPQVEVEAGPSTPS